MEMELKIWRSLRLVNMVTYFESILTEWFLVGQIPHKWNKYPRRRGSRELSFTLHRQEQKKASCKNQKVKILQKTKSSYGSLFAILLLFVVYLLNTIVQNTKCGYYTLISRLKE